MNLTTCQAFIGKRRIGLTTTESNLLAVLLENQGNILTREELLSSAWGESYQGTARTVDTHIQRLRRKLGRAARRIRTVRGVGYELMSA